MAIPEIRALLPHAGPMVLLDRLVAADAESIIAEVLIRPNSLFCRADGVGAWVGMEYMAQAIGAYSGYKASLRGEPVRLGYLLGTRRYEARCPSFAVGALLRIHVRRVFQSENGLGSFECRIDGDGELLASASLTVYQPKDDDDIAAPGLI